MQLPVVYSFVTCDLRSIAVWEVLGGAVALGWRELQQHSREDRPWGGGRRVREVFSGNMFPISGLNVKMFL